MNILISILAAIGGVAVGYVIKHFQDDFYLKKIASSWIEDAKEVDRLRRENERLMNVVNEYQRRDAVKAMVTVDGEEWLKRLNNTKVGKIPDDPEIDFGGFKL